MTKLLEGLLNWKSGVTCHRSVMPLQVKCRGQEAAGNQCQQSQLPRAPNDYPGDHEVMCWSLCVSCHPLQRKGALDLSVLSKFYLHASYWQNLKQIQSSGGEGKYFREFRIDDCSGFQLVVVCECAVLRVDDILR